MVSFSCENCGDVMTKKKLDPHRNRCRGATFTCIDCMTHFYGVDYRSHTSCISEEQKYQGALYKPKKGKQPQQQEPVEQYQTPAGDDRSRTMAHIAYVEDAPEDYDEYDFNDDEDDVRPRSGPMPHAPTPPSGADQHVNVFDFLVANPTPKPSNSDLRAEALASASEDEKPDEGTQLVRFQYDTVDSIEKSQKADDEKRGLVQYGADSPVLAANLQTPAPRADKKKSRDGDKKDKKRKRLHLDIHDSVMTDAPPILHSGLTGGLKGMMRGPSVFPPSPEYSADAAETPASPLKKTRHSKHSSSGTNRVTSIGSIGNNLMSMLTGPSKPKTTKKRKHGSPGAKKSSKSKHKHEHDHHHHHHHKSSDGEKAEKIEKMEKVEKVEKPHKAKKMIEYRPGSKDSKDSDKSKDKNQSVVVYGKHPQPADVLLGLVNKGPDSERGCSMNKALKRFHRELSSSGSSTGKLMDEKELWRSLRLRKNDRGEVVLFCV
ncbi:hypothetical protein RB595_000864 [Gaeumannomyces hyphopodioides]